MERLALPPLENLSDDPSLDWVGWGISEVLAAQLTGSAKLHPLRVRSARDAALSGATAILRGYFTMEGGRIHLVVSHEDVPSMRLDWSLTLQEAFPDGILRAAAALSRRLDPAAHPSDTQSVAALKAFAEARSSQDPQAAVSAFGRAVGADPDLGAAYVGWAQTLFARGDRAGAAEVIGKARARGGRIAAAPRAELDLISAALSGDAESRRQALAALNRATPADVEVVRRLASEETAAHHYEAAAGYYRKAVALDPADGATWNQLGYAEALRGKLDAARAALLEYQRLTPQGANPLDSLGDVHYYFGSFPDAEKFYLQAYDKDNSFLGGAELCKAAYARLMAGDPGGADELFRRYAAVRRAARDPVIGFRQLQWTYILGRRSEAISGMKQLALAPSPAPDAVSLAASQLAIWSLAAGDQADALQWSAKAASVARSSAAGNLALLCRFLAEPSTPPAALPAALQRRALAYRFLLAKQFAEAIPQLRALVTEADPLGGGESNVLLAWALVETGSVEEAARLLQTYGIPQPGGEEPFACFAFPRAFQLRIVVLEKQGRAREAGRLREVFKKLSGH